MNTAALGRQHAGGDRRGEHQQRSHERVDDELDRRAHAARLAPPAADQEVEGDQHQVEEGDEEGQVLREERPQDGRLGEHEVEVEEPRALPRAQVRGQHGGGEQQPRQRDEEHVQPADAELVVNAQLGDPGDVGDVLQARAPGAEVGDVADREAQRGQRAQQRGAAAQALLAFALLHRARRGR